MPVIGCAADRRVNLQAVRSTKLNEARIKCLARVDRIVVRGMDEEDRCLDMLHCVEKPLSQLGRSVPAIPSAGKKHKRPEIRFSLGLQECEGTPKRVVNECHPVCIDLSKPTQKSQPRGGGTQFSVLQ